MISLADLLRGHIALGVHVRDWREAVRAAGSLLEATGEITRGYTDAMVRTVQELGPYAVVAPGVALPHARPEDGVIRSCLGLVRLAQPVEFGNEVNDPVDLVMPFGSSRTPEHTQLLAELARFLGAPEHLDALRTARTEHEVIRVFEGLKPSGGNG